MNEFIALCAKSYAYVLEGKTTIKSKEIRPHVVKNHLSIEDHKRCLMETGTEDNDVSDDSTDDESMYR